MLQDSPSIAFVCWPYCLQARDLQERIHGKGLRSALKFRNMFHIIDDEPAPLSSIPLPPALFPLLTIVLCADADAEGDRNESLMSFLWNAQRVNA